MTYDLSNPTSRTGFGLRSSEIMLTLQIFSLLKSLFSYHALLHVPPDDRHGRPLSCLASLIMNDRMNRRSTSVV